MIHWLEVHDPGPGASLDATTSAVRDILCGVGEDVAVVSADERAIGREDRFRLLAAGPRDSDLFLPVEVPAVALAELLHWRCGFEVSVHSGIPDGVAGPLHTRGDFFRAVRALGAAWGHNQTVPQAQTWIRAYDALMSRADRVLTVDDAYSVGARLESERLHPLRFEQSR